MVEINNEQLKNNFLSDIYSYNEERDGKKEKNIIVDFDDTLYNTTFIFSLILSIILIDNIKIIDDKFDGEFSKVFNNTELLIDIEYIKHNFKNSLKHTLESNIQLSKNIYKIINTYDILEIINDKSNEFKELFNSEDPNDNKGMINLIKNFLNYFIKKDYSSFRYNDFLSFLEKDIYNRKYYNLLKSFTTDCPNLLLKETFEDLKISKKMISFFNTLWFLPYTYASSLRTKLFYALNDFAKTNFCNSIIVISHTLDLENTDIIAQLKFRKLLEDFDDEVKEKIEFIPTPTSNKCDAIVDEKIEFDSIIDDRFENIYQILKDKRIDTFGKEIIIPKTGYNQFTENKFYEDYDVYKDFKDFMNEIYLQNNQLYYINQNFEFNIS